MSLSEEQNKQVAQWIAEGASLSEVQKRILSDFAINLTYMDVRFLVDDLEIDLSANEEEAVTEEDTEDATQVAPVPTDEVTVEIEKIARPGSVLSGNVTFTDGVTVGWQLDQSGRLGLIPKEEGYQPPADDLPVFQQKLQEAVTAQSQGIGGL